MGRRGRVFGSGLRIGRLTVFLSLLSAVLAASIVVGGQPNHAVADPVTEGLSRIDKIVPANPDDFTFAVFGDNRGSTTIFERLLSQISGDPDILFAVSTGDIVGMGTRGRFDFFFSQITRYLTKPLVFAAGNHELTLGGTNLYESTVGRLNYSFVFGDAYFIVIDDTDESRIDSLFEEWLRKELEAAGRYRETLIFMHVPLYDPPGTDIRHSLAPTTAKQLMDIFRDYRITYIFSSHIHGYFTGDWEEIPYTISGGAGAPLVGTDPAHFFYHYLKVRVNKGVVTAEPVPVTAPAGE